MRWQFTIIYPDATEEIIDEPVGWDAIEWSAKRNMKHHGMFFSISTDSFQFVGDGFTILSNAYDTDGANADLGFRVEYDCDGTGWVQYYLGKFDFNTYKRQCGDYCYISISIAPDSCVDRFLSLNNQEVDLTSTQDFNGNSITGLSSDSVKFNGQTFKVHDWGNNDTGENKNKTIYDVSGSTGNRFYYIPIFLPSTTGGVSEFGVFNENGIDCAPVYKNGGQSVITSNTLENYLLYGTNLLVYRPLDNQGITVFDLDYKLNGDFNITPNFNGTATLNIAVFKKNWPEDNDFVDYGSFTGTGVTLTAGLTTTIPFSLAGTYLNEFQPTPLTSAVYYYFYLQVNKTSASALDSIACNMDYYGDNYFKMTAPSLLPSVQVPCYKLSEVMPFLCNAYVGQDCFDVYDYTNRFEYFHITNGRKIRRITLPTDTPIRLSYQKAFEESQKIFNLGWGFANQDTELWFGKLDKFYDYNTVVFDAGAIDKAMFTNAQDLTFSIVKIGYNKWAGEEVNGLDEMNTERKYARNIDSNNNEKELMTDFISAGYTIEMTRRKSQDIVGTQDWRFDDDVFIVNTIQVEAEVYETYNGVDFDAANIFSPSTRYNYKITPARMMMEWMNYFTAPNPTHTNDNLIFRYGTGNILAEGRMYNDYFVEDLAISESQTLNAGDFYYTADAIPYWKTIYAEFTAPFGMADAQAVYSTPYAMVSFRCANETYYGYIVEIRHNPNEGIASFKLLLYLPRE
jgi:hypothetical protein